jgi:multidrug efflux pump subunit AcrA (membrane-fusion protein)
MAEHNQAQVLIVSAQLEQTRAQVDRVQDQLQRTLVTAPFDGVVVSGDLSQLAGSPVEQGKKLFEIAPLSSYRVILQVDEREIRHVEVGQKGHLVISGIAEDPTPFTVVKVTPVATAQDGRNFFRVEAHLEHAPPRLRPGMEGIGKVSVGEQRLWWVLTHSFTDWLRLTLWTWTL